MTTYLPKPDDNMMAGRVATLELGVLRPVVHIYLRDSAHQVLYLILIEHLSDNV